MYDALELLFNMHCRKEKGNDWIWNETDMWNKKPRYMFANQHITYIKNTNKSEDIMLWGINNIGNNSYCFTHSFHE